MGVYSFFNYYDVTVNSGITCEASDTTNILFTNSLAVHLNGGGGISHIVNNDGNAVDKLTQVSYLCTFPVPT